MPLLNLLCASFLFFILAACPAKNNPAAPKPKGLEELIKRGRLVYQTNCTACHNSDPKKPGNIGPDLYGSPRELIESRVMRAEYPRGYKPKRTTKVMLALPQLQNDIDALAAFLNN